MIRSFHPSILRLLRVFHAVAKYKGFSAAQTVLNVGQPTISSHIKDLEDKLNFEVCERGRAGFRLTAAGERLYEATQRLERDLAGFIAAVNEIQNELQGTVRMGLTYWLSQVPMLTALPSVLGVLHRDFPSIQLELHLDTAREIEEGIVDGRYDLAISGSHLDAKNVEILPLFDMRMSLYCARGQQLYSVADEKIEDSLLLESGWVLNVYDTHRQAPFQGAEPVLSEGSEASIFYILSGKYIGYLNEFVAAPWVKSGHLRALRPAKYGYDAPGGLLLPEHSAANPAVKKVVELLRKLARTGNSTSIHTLLLANQTL